MLGLILGIIGGLILQCVICAILNLIEGSGWDGIKNEVKR